MSIHMALQYRHFPLCGSDDIDIPIASIHDAVLKFP